MPKVLRILNRLNIGGPAYNGALLTKFMEPDFDTMLLVGCIDKAEGNGDYLTSSLGIKPIIIPEMKRSINPRLDYIAYKKIVSIIKDFKPDIVHTHASKAGALGRSAAFNLQIPVIIHTFHGHVFDKYFGRFEAETYKFIERRLARKTNRIIVLSKNQQEDIVDKYKICSLNKTRIIPLGFDLQKFSENKLEKRNKFRNEYFLDEETVAIGIIGRLAPIKNHFLFLKALKDLKDNSKFRFRAFIIGDGEERQRIEEYASSISLSFTSNPIESPKNNITFTSWIKDIDIALSGLDIIALTSLNEGTPVSLIEAQAAGKPIVSTNVGGIHNVVIPNETALLSDLNDNVAFSKNLLDLTNNKHLREKLSEKGYEFVKNKFHYNRLINDTKKLYFECLNNNNS